MAASLIEGIGDACVQVASKTVVLNGLKLSNDLQKPLIELQNCCCEAHEQALKSFVKKDIVLAESVRSFKNKVDTNSSRIEEVAKDASVDLMPQVLAVVSLLRQIYERSVDMADLVV